MTELLHNLNSGKQVFIKVPVTARCKRENEFSLWHFSHNGCFCSTAATTCGDIQHHRQVSVLQNLHQPIRLIPGPEEVEV